ncbi:hypothetical protein PHYBLDRAFT_140882 [Phycomyces blakesleeanus NRRL 1555(-)]|uniref:Uncharacterized protein n=1 Tax=Phycomyces blakesleeanus (strain ATCC 8743b / DSM 1359 / FGSC 10004 / NBRC 33097 / NRRL 1555) TaxID=763407 RepID=A0A167PZQ4_PHYB8|nr:hypothetical protein PHYBLDRAFT_140882 [Phycomyces blakesleeanus NRRL 1555(-)]OAD78828.1 hypothetical protein PHYBLDRAFT_140882 [Phycomyces blakesleeanus NRRL 1555(-)]|eukprot:XP_018296868.1 hypothetical protein PHYBLDRAFT_140882 [Phycomyces blakesleeanus NRRL 1555(-)]
MGPLFFTFDKMHGLCHGIGKQKLAWQWQQQEKQFQQHFIALEEMYPSTVKLQSWNIYLKDLHQKDKIEITVFTINQNLLQHYPNIIGAFGSSRAYSTRSVERAIGKYSCTIKSNLAIGMNAGNIIVWLARIRQLLTDSEGGKQRGVVLQYEDMSAGWPITSKGECADADSNIKF